MNLCSVEEGGMWQMQLELLYSKPREMLKLVRQTKEFVLFTCLKFIGYKFILIISISERALREDYY